VKADTPLVGLGSGRTFQESAGCRPARDEAEFLRRTFMRTRIVLPALAAFGIAGFTGVPSSDAQQPRPPAELDERQPVMPEPHDEMLVQRFDEIEWQPAPEVLPPGAEMAVIRGNPATEEEHVLMVSVPEGYGVPRHWHPIDEQVTVIQGDLELRAQGLKEPQEVGEGDIFQAPARHVHAIRCVSKGGCIFTVQGTGVFAINYVDREEVQREFQAQAERARRHHQQAQQRTQRLPQVIDQYVDEAPRTREPVQPQREPEIDPRPF
jgi:quercetin dioxygenase-like cupin family protein